MDDFAYITGPNSESEESVLLGRGFAVARIPADRWRNHVVGATERISARLAFMSSEHHLVRRFAVIEIARRGRPLTESRISRQLKLPLNRVHSLLGELESRLFFLARDSRRRVTWAYPFTADQTPHKVLRSGRPFARAA